MTHVEIRSLDGTDALQDAAAKLADLFETSSTIVSYIVVAQAVDVENDTDARILQAYVRSDGLTSAATVDILESAAAQERQRAEEA
jgi:hypothetical protein